MSQLLTQNVNAAANDIIDISFESARKKRFRIDKDDNRILELDTTDLTIVDRFKTKIDELIAVVDNGFKTTSTDNEEDIDNVIGSLKEVDKNMRTIIDEIFQSNVSEICAPTGSMLDPINGKFRFEHIFEVLIPLYENDINTELGKFNSRIQKHTSKYIK